VKIEEQIDAAPEATELEEPEEEQEQGMSMTMM